MSNRKMKVARVGNLRQNTRGKNTRNNSMMRRIIPHPPEIDDYQIIHGKTLRFRTNAAFNGAITFQNLLDLILMVTSAVTAFDLFFMVKLKRVKVWALPTLGQTTDITVIFNGITAGSQGDRSVHTDASMGIEPAFVDCRPRQESLASKYQSSSAAIAFFLDVPNGAVIDVSLSYKSDVSGTAVAAQNAVVGATTGGVAFRGLDGLPIATSKFTTPGDVLQL